MSGLAPALLRSTLIVADLERSTEFYRTLGFEVESDIGGPRASESKPFPLNVPARAFKLRILRSAQPDGGHLGLLSFSDPAPGVTRPVSDEVGIGDVVLVVRINNAGAAHAALTAAGARIVAAPTRYEMKRSDGSVGRGSLFHVFDPDGHVVELIAPE
ncbi:MAG TPA: VOC family protein [Steroidobacteraceae bacterium]|nr:VOC family protein [Steroidobacteraceae bacterium]